MLMTLLKMCYHLDRKDQRLSKTQLILTQTQVQVRLTKSNELHSLQQIILNLIHMTLSISLLMKTQSKLFLLKFQNNTDQALLLELKMKFKSLF